MLCVWYGKVPKDALCVLRELRGFSGHLCCDFIFSFHIHSTHTATTYLHYYLVHIHITYLHKTHIHIYCPYAHKLKCNVKAILMLTEKKCFSFFFRFWSLKFPTGVYIFISIIITSIYTTTWIAWTTFIGGTWYRAIGSFGRFIGYMDENVSVWFSRWTNYVSC